MSCRLLRRARRSKSAASWRDAVCASVRDEITPSSHPPIVSDPVPRSGFVVTRCSSQTGDRSLDGSLPAPRASKRRLSDYLRDSLPAPRASKCRLSEREVARVAKGIQAHAPVSNDAQVRDAAVEPTHAQPAFGRELQRPQHKETDHVHVTHNDLVLVLRRHARSTRCRRRRRRRRRHRRCGHRRRLSVLLSVLREDESNAIKRNHTQTRRAFRSE